MVTVSALIIGSLWFVADNRYVPRTEINEKYVQTTQADQRYVQQEALYGALSQLDRDRDIRDLENSIERLEAKEHLKPELFNEYDQYQLESAKRKLEGLR